MTHAFDTSPAAGVSAEPVATWQPVVLDGGRDTAANTPDTTPNIPPVRARRRLVGLDGLRAVAVLAVVVFHLEYASAPGGFLGVDVFFVISGLLITNLVADEILATGALRLRRFYARRARRLLPTVLAMITVVSLASLTIWRDQLATLRGAVLSSLGYVTNWWLIADDQSYFASTGRPSMFQHLWSLAIEEQFYLVWSVAVVALVGFASRRARGIDPAARVRLVALVALVLAIASTLTMAVLAIRSDLPWRGSTSRVYFGSDTHAMGLFLGSACGAWLAVRRNAEQHRPDRLPAKLVWFTDVVGMVLLVVVIAQFFDVSEFSPALYRGGMLAFDALVLAVVLCAIRRRSLLGRILDMRPIRWIGRRSYSIYVWHWPVVVVTRPGLDVHGPAWLIDACRLALVLGLAALSYHFIEVPLRSGQFRRWRELRRSGTRRRWDTAAILTTLVAALGLGATAGAVSTPSPTSVFRPPGTVHSIASVEPVPTTAITTPPAPVRTNSGRSGAAAPVAPPPLRVSAFGDSVLLGGSAALAAVVVRLDLDAVEGRQPYEVLDDVRAAAERHALQPYVVVHTGNNGVISPDQLRATLTAMHDRTRVVLLNDRVDRDWQDPNNHTIRDVARGFTNVVVVDWHGLSEHRPHWLYTDGLHLTKGGAVAYARIVRAALVER